MSTSQPRNISRRRRSCQGWISTWLVCKVQLHLVWKDNGEIYWKWCWWCSYIDQAVVIPGLNVTTVCVYQGALGKRTRFQHKFLAQLILEVKRKQQPGQTDNEASPTPTPLAYLPKVSFCFFLSSLVFFDASFITLNLLLLSWLTVDLYLNFTHMFRHVYWDRSFT